MTSMTRQAVNKPTMNPCLKEFWTTKSRNKVLKRDVFLDHVETEEFILSQIEVLMRIASENGKAVGIGHETKEITYRVLQKEIPRILKKGYELIFVSEMLGK